MLGCLKHLNIYTIDGIDYLYLGFEDYDEHRYGTWGHRMFIYSFIQDSLNFVEEIYDCGFDLVKFAGYDHLVAFDYHGWGDEFENHYHRRLRQVSMTIPAEVESITGYENSLSFTFTYLNRNDLNYEDYGLILWKSPDHSFHCYAPDFSEILWERYNPVIGNMIFRASTCVSTNEGDHFVMGFWENYYEQIYYCEIRNRINGNIALSEEPAIMPFVILRQSDGELFFFTKNDSLVDIYTLAEEIQVGSEDNEIAINNYDLCNYPNPFNPETEISFNLQVEADVELAIYNLKGEKVKVLMKEHFAAGEHSALWQGRNESNNKVSSGIYFIRLMSNGESGGIDKCL